MTTATTQPDQLKNLRITPLRKYQDPYGTGDSQAYNVYQVRRDFYASELNNSISGKPWNFAPGVTEAGITMETFRSELNAAIFINAIADREYLVADLVSLKKSIGYVAEESRKWFTPFGKKETEYPHVKKDDGYASVLDQLTALSASVVPVNLDDLRENEYLYRNVFTAAYALIMVQRAEDLLDTYKVLFSRDNPADGVNYPVSLGSAVYGLQHIVFTINQRNKFI